MDPDPITIGRYVVEKLVGVGAMGRVYRAHDPDIRRTVAVKLISTNLMGSVDRTDYIRRFRREAEAAARCVHPNIVAIYDFALHEGEPFLAMEFVNGTTLRAVLDEKPVMAVADALEVMLQVLDALERMHGQGVIHQDIKPGNMMLTPNKQVKVADFGVSRIANTDITTTFTTVGTPAYMSPEQCRGEAVDGRSDLFAAGATLFEMLAGQRAFSGRNATEVSHRIQNERLPLLPAEVTAAVPRLQLVLDRATNKLPEDRFDSAADMAEALRQLLGSLSDDATRIPRDAATVQSKYPPQEQVVPPSGPAGPPVDPDMLRLLEGKLRDYFGPIASVLLRVAANRNRSAEELCAELALRIRDEAERERFRREVQRVLPPRRVPTAGMSSRDDSGNVGSRLSKQELERAQTTLIQFVGPIAGVLVRRAAANASTVEALWQTLAHHIESPAERAAFLRERQK
jgi:eukaryotic-like serine/threonine-protein kinase